MGTNVSGFSIAFLRQDQQPRQPATTRLGTVTIGDFEERFESSVEFWSEAQYELQWAKAIHRLISGAAESALITSITSAATANFLFWWILYRVDQHVHFQHHVLFLSELSGAFDPENPYQHIPQRATTSDDGAPISEWVLPFHELISARPVRNARSALELLSDHLPELRSKFSVRSLRLFGSIARNEANHDSDIDVLVEFFEKPTFDHYLGLKLYLEELFGKAVDLVIASDLRPGLRSRIEQEALHVT
ncbi:MAG: nucleotidyltransferase domain-containing protein [Candidatus Saccharimonadales bacterium]